MPDQPVPSSQPPAPAPPAAEITPDTLKAASAEISPDTLKAALPEITPDTLKAALKAFRRRLKLTQLDDASRIGRGPMSGGLGSSIAGITAPDQYPRAVWEELVKQGKLKPAGHGTYSLVQ